MRNKDRSILLTRGSRQDFVLGVLGATIVLIVLGSLGYWYADYQWEHSQIGPPYQTSTKYMVMSVVAMAMVSFWLHGRYPSLAKGVWLTLVLTVIGCAASYQINDLLANLR